MDYEKGMSILQSISSGTELPRQNNMAASYALVPPNANQVCDPIKPTISNMIDPNLLTQSNPDVINFTYTNTSGFTKRILLGVGTVGSVAAIAAKYTGIFPSADALGPAIGSAGVVDGGGSNCVQTQLVNAQTLGRNIIVKSIKVKASSTQISQPLTMVSVDFNFNSYPIPQEFTLVNTQLNYAILENCPIPLTNFQGAYYDILNGETVTMTLEVLGWGIVQGTAPKLVH